MARRDQWNPFANKFRNHVNHELVDFAFVQKRRNDASATHPPDVLTFLYLQVGCESFNWRVH